MEQHSNAQVADVALEELRIAGVLNGGVSLAVWMGGVALEIDLLTRSSPDPDDAEVSRPSYRTVLAVARSKAVVDVIAGTSAGGINGGALALSQVNENADLSTLRSLWSDQGRMQSLLRKPFEGQPTSLMRGDDYFLPELARAMTSLAGDFRPRKDRQVHLTMPVTLLSATTLETPDSQGHLMRQQVHGGSFQFLLDANRREQIEEQVPAVALAARTSAGFPFAFEPSFIPVHEHTRSVDPLRPAMERWASWTTDWNEHVDEQLDEPLPSDAPCVNRSRYAIDGGVLSNTPTRQALRAIQRRRASVPVRRVMTLIFPHADQVTVELGEQAATPPTVTSAALGMFSALRAQGSLTFVEEIDAHNRRVSAWRGGRTDVLERYARPALLYALVGAGWPAYQRLRERVAADLLAENIKHPGWSFERVRDQALAAQEAATGEGTPAQQAVGLPYVPLHPPPHPDSRGGEPGSETGSWRWGPLVATGVLDSVTEVLRLAFSVAVTSTGEEPGAPGDPEQRPEATILRDARRQVGDLEATLGEIRTAIQRPWNDPVAQALEPTTDYWAARLVSFRQMMGVGDPAAEEMPLGQHLQNLVDRLPETVVQELTTARIEAWRAALIESPVDFGAQVSDLVTRAAGVLAEPDMNQLLLRVASEERGRLVGLRAWRHLLDLADDPDLGGAPDDQPEPEDLTARMLSRLLALDTATWLIARGGSGASGPPIDLVQLDLSIAHGFTTYTKTPDEKAAGLSVGRFGGFLKRSWRLNDWIWGRLDAAQVLCRIVLDPRRLRRIQRILHDADHDDPGLRQEYVDQVLAQLDACYPAEVPPSVAGLRTAAHDELQHLFAPGSVAPSRLPALAEYAARPRQWRIILEELPFLAAAVRLDGLEGQNRRSRGDRFLLENESLLSGIAHLSQVPDRWGVLGEQCLIAFDRAGIGREDLTEEAGSDALIKTAASAAAVGITVLDSANLGVRFFRPVTRVVRGASLLPYWLVTGLTRGPGLARALAITGFAMGGLLFVLGVLGVLGAWSSAGAAAGAATLLAAFAYAALRTGSLLHGVVLLSPIAPFYAYTVEHSGSHDTVTGALTSVGIVAGLVAGLALLGSLPSPLRSPVAIAGDALRKTGAYLAEAAVRFAHWKPQWWFGVAVGVVVIGVAAVEQPEHRWDERVDEASAREPWVTIGVLCAIGVLGSVIAYRRGTTMRTWTDGPGASGHQLQQVRHPAGVAAGWAAAYGWLYLLASALLVLASDTPRHPVQAVTGPEADPVLATSIAWTATLGVLLLLVVPSLITYGARRRFERRLTGDPTLPEMTDVSAATTVLRRRGFLFRYLVAGFDDQDEVRLTGRGRILADRLRREHRMRQKQQLGW